MSYRKKHVKSKIHNIKPKKSIFKKIWFWIILLFFIAVLSIIYFLFFYSSFQLKNIVISGNDKIKTQDIQEVVLNNVSIGLVDFLSINIDSKSIFLINSGKINKEILEKFSKIEKVTINKNFPQTLTLNITERKPIGAYCSKDDCFLIDKNGIAFEPLTTLPVDTVIVWQNIDNNQISNGQEVVAKDIISAISKIQKSLKDNFQIDLKEALIDNPLRLDITTNENWHIYFDLTSNSDINLQITKLNLLLKSEISESQRKSLRYIDLRPKDRAVVCDNMECGR